MKKWYSENWSSNTKFSIQYDQKLYSGRSKFQKIDFYKSKEWGVFFTLDELMMLTEKDEFAYHDMIVHPAMAVNTHIQNVLVIGGGDGGTVRELTRYSSIKNIDMVEIDEKVVTLSKLYLKQTSDKLEDSRVTLYFEDGVNFVEKSKDKTYDLILVDSTDPIGPGEGLFSTKFYQNCFRILSDSGILINQHETPYFEQYIKEMQRAHAKLKKVFPISKVYQFHQAVYPSGHWLFGFASKGLDPIKDHKPNEWSLFNLKTKYYNNEIHKGAFALPNYVKEILEIK